MTIADIQARQAVAARRYEAALAELYASWVSLAAHDHAVANENVGGGDLRTFGSNLDDHRAALHAHPLVSQPDPVPLSSRVGAARLALLKQVSV